MTKLAVFVFRQNQVWVGLKKTIISKFELLLVYLIIIYISQPSCKIKIIESAICLQLQNEWMWHSRVEVCLWYRVPSGASGL